MIVGILFGMVLLFIILIIPLLKWNRMELSQILRDMNESEEIMDRENTLAINLQGICKSFSVGKRKVEVLKKVDVSINSGEMIAIMGASGCGKSTLLNIIGCLDIADAGEYWLRGEKLQEKAENKWLELEMSYLVT